MEAPVATASPRVGWLLPLVVALAAWGVFSYAAPFTPVSSDATRDQLLVRDCVELGRCHTVGAPTSVPGIRQGAGWIDLLALLRRAGLDVNGQRRVTLFLNGLAVATLFLVAAYLRRSSAWPAALFAMIAVMQIGTARLLINTSLDVLPEMICSGALLLFALEGEVLLMVVASLALGTAVNFHVGAMSLFPALLLLAAHRALWQVAVALALSSVTALLTSWEAWSMNMEELRERHLLVPLAMGAALCVAGGWALRRVRPTLSVPLALAILLGPFALGFLWLVKVEHHVFVASYLHPVLGPLCLGVALVAGALLDRAPEVPSRAMQALSVTLGVIVLAFAVEVRASTFVDPGWSYDDARIVARQLTDHGATWSEAASRLQAPRCHDLIPAVGIYMDARKPAEQRHTVFQVKPGSAGALESKESWLRPEKLRACRIPIGGGAPACVDAAPPNGPESVPIDRFLFSPRIDLATHRLSTPAPFVARYEIELSAGAGHTELRVLDEDPRCGWRITSVEGLLPGDPLPATHVAINGAPGAWGQVRLERPIGTPECPTREVEALFLPCLGEGSP